MKATMKTSLYMLIMIISNLMFSACSTHIEKVKKEPKVIKKKIVKKISMETILTPIQKCTKEDNKYNLIVNTSNGARVRILNIKPVYKDCIALKKGKYHIEVSKVGFSKYKEWIDLESDTEMFVELNKLNIVRVRDDSIKEIAQLEEAGYDSIKLKNFINKCPKSNRSLIAKNRLGVIKHKFKGYSPTGIIKSNNCIGFYPKRLVELNLKTKNTTEKFWNSIEWNGSCKKSLMTGRGTLHFKSDGDISVELKGKMKNGFFQGKVYNQSKAKDHSKIIKDNKKGYKDIELKNRFDFIYYQE